MANTIKTLRGEILVSEVEAIMIDNLAEITKNPKLLATVTAVGRSGTKYDIVLNYPGDKALKIFNAAVNFVAGTGHQVFDAGLFK